MGNEFGYEWTSVAYQETHSGNTTTIILIMALLVAYLVLAAQYESWTSPVAAVMGLPVAILGAMLGCWVMGVPVSIYTQIGIILLIALSAKNGILIVEFARDYRKAGNPIREAAYEAGHVRLRPILMTSFTFVQPFLLNILHHFIPIRNINGSKNRIHGHTKYYCRT